jgi:hypothetical protein
VTARGGRRSEAPRKAPGGTCQASHPVPQPPRRCVCRPSCGRHQGVASRQAATRNHRPAAVVQSTRGRLAVGIETRPGVGLDLRLAIRIGSWPGLGPEMGQAQGIGSWPGLDPRRRLSAPGRGSHVQDGAGPPGGQRAPEHRQGLPGLLQGEASWNPRPRRGRRGERRRCREDRGEDDRYGNEAATRTGHRELSFSQRRPPRRPGWPAGRLQGLKVRRRAGGSVGLTDEASVGFENFDRPLTT